MKTIKFNQNVVIDFLQGKGEETFYAGKEYDLEDDQADRWLRRGKADLVEPSTKASASNDMDELQRLADAAKPKTTKK